MLVIPIQSLSGPSLGTHMFLIAHSQQGLASWDRAKRSKRCARNNFETSSCSEAFAGSGGL
jgi:hypothetical protein